MAQSIIKKFGSALGWEEEDAYENHNGPVLLTRPQFKLSVFTPRVFEDLKGLADALLDKSGVMISFEKVDVQLRRRMIDYMNGVGYATGAQVEKITENTIIYVPESACIEKEAMTAAKTRKWF